jgi:hypothetical protein
MVESRMYAGAASKELPRSRPSLTGGVIAVLVVDHGRSLGLHQGLNRGSQESDPLLFETSREHCQGNAMESEASQWRNLELRRQVLSKSGFWRDSSRRWG